VGTPAGAVRAGADVLVVGRAVTGADDPERAAAAIADEVAGAVPGA
jgi:orotidine-5'-phosphate decarboxylase